MDIRSNYYAVTINTTPFEYSGKKEIGCYSTKDIAEEVAKFVMTTFKSRVSGGIDLDIRECTGELIQMGQGFRLKDTPKGRLNLIKDTFTSRDATYLRKQIPKWINPNLIDCKPEAKGIIDIPKRIIEGDYHSLVLNFPSFDNSHQLFVGFYQTRKTAEEISMYIINTHQYEKNGDGFDTSISTCSGKFIEYESGKLYLNVDEEAREIKSECESVECARVSKAVEKAIEKWLGAPQFDSKLFLQELLGNK